MLALWRKWALKKGSETDECALSATLFSDARLLVYRHLDARSLGRLLIVSSHFFRELSSPEYQDVWKEKASQFVRSTPVLVGGALCSQLALPANDSLSWVDVVRSLHKNVCSVCTSSTIENCKVRRCDGPGRGSSCPELWVVCATCNDGGFVSYVHTCDVCHQGRCLSCVEADARFGSLVVQFTRALPWSGRESPWRDWAKCTQCDLCICQDCGGQPLGPCAACGSRRCKAALCHECNDRYLGCPYSNSM